MYGKIMIGTKETAMLANAASPYLFKQVFHEDFLLVSRRMVDEQDEAVKDATASDIFVRMGFIMAMQATKKQADLYKIGYQDFYTWMEQYEPNDILMAVNDIALLYKGQEVPSSVPKQTGV